MSTQTDIAKVLAKLRSIIDKAPREVKKMLTKTARVVARRMKSYTPVDSGALRKAIQTKSYISRGRTSVGALAGVDSRYAVTGTGKKAKTGETFSKLPNRYAAVINYGRNLTLNYASQVKGLGSRTGSFYKQKAAQGLEQQVLRDLEDAIDLLIRRL